MSFLLVSLIQVCIFTVIRILFMVHQWESQLQTELLLQLSMKMEMKPRPISAA